MGSRQRGLVLLTTLLGGAALVASPAAHAASAAAAPDSAAAREDSVATASLAASTAPPWNPSAPVPWEEPWERVVRFPGLVLSWPLRQLGTLVDRGLTSAEEAKLVPKTVAIAQVPAANGVVIAPASLGDRTGFGVALRLAPPRVGKFVRLAWEGSTLQYSRTTLRLGYGPAWLEYQYEWRPQDAFFGSGLDTSPAEESNFASERQHLVVRVLQRAALGRARLAADAWAGERSLVMRPGKGSDGPSFDVRFPSLAGLDDLHEDSFTAGATFAYDGRVKGIQHWVRGVRAAITAESFEELAQSRLFFPGTQVASTFGRVRYELESGWSFFMADPRTVRLALRVVDQHVDRGVLLLPDLASLGGSEGLAGFEPRRFHDVDAAVGRLTYLFPIGKHLELDLHAEAGGVYGDVWRGLRLSTLRRSGGFALRPRSDTAVLGALGLDWSSETVRFRYSLGGEP